MSVVKSEEAGAKVVEWYNAIVSRSYEQAILLKEEVNRLVNEMEKNDKIIAYYSLVDYRHNLLIKGYDKNAVETDFKRIEEVAHVDNMLKYFYYFVRGQNEYVHERYRSAVKLFSKLNGYLINYKMNRKRRTFTYTRVGVLSTQSILNCRFLLGAS
ncbi:RapH N-terminal domain-containing protein [Bacillus sp. JCM 19041]|uniref:response regulator aspartate phosphatase n=1 Tax=Bacillus sp. JCM 19041 TaxID=1460637 RepID=UPI0006D01353